MSSSTSLLPKQVTQDDHPIFLRVCHSPWPKFGQKALTAVRTITTAWLGLSFAAILHYDAKINYKYHEVRNPNGHALMTIFDFGNITYGLLGLYTGIASLWTFMHLHYPHHNRQPRDAKSRFQKFLSPPRQHQKTKNRVFFSLFYTIATSWPYLSSFIHWAVEVPSHHSTFPANEHFKHGRYREFYVVSKYIVLPVLAFLEVFFYSSIRCAKPIWSHALGISVLSMIYIAWGFIGHEITGNYLPFFLDHFKYGGGKTAGGVILFVIGANLVSGLNYGFTRAREKATRKAEQKSRGYNRLPQ